MAHNHAARIHLAIDLRETGSVRWTTIATLLPLGLGFLVTFLVAALWRWGS